MIFQTSRLHNAKQKIIESCECKVNRDSGVEFQKTKQLRKLFLTYRIGRNELDRFRIWRVFCLNENRSDLQVAIAAAAEQVFISIVLRRGLSGFGLKFGWLVLRMEGKRRVARC